MFRQWHADTVISIAWKCWYHRHKEEKGDENEDTLEIEALKYPKEYYEYKLTGIVVHTGTADSGHYYSFI